MLGDLTVTGISNNSISQVSLINLKQIVKQIVQLSTNDINVDDFLETDKLIRRIVVKLRYPLHKGIVTLHALLVLTMNKM